MVEQLEAKTIVGWLAELVGGVARDSGSIL
jgi:hypothetical protein